MIEKEDIERIRERDREREWERARIGESESETESGVRSMEKSSRWYLQWLWGIVSLRWSWLIRPCLCLRKTKQKFHWNTSSITTVLTKLLKLCWEKEMRKLVRFFKGIRTWSGCNTVLSLSIARRLVEVALEAGVDALRPIQVGRNVTEVSWGKSSNEWTLWSGN